MAEGEIKFAGGHLQRHQLRIVELGPGHAIDIGQLVAVRIDLPVMELRVATTALAVGIGNSQDPRIERRQLQILPELRLEGQRNLELNSATQSPAAGLAFSRSGMPALLYFSWNCWR